MQDFHFVKVTEACRCWKCNYLCSHATNSHRHSRCLDCEKSKLLDCRTNLERVPLPLGAWDGLHYFIGTRPEPTIGKHTPSKLSFVYTSQVKLTVRTEPKFG